MRLYNVTKQREVGPIRRAGNFFSRLKGLLGSCPEREKDGLWLVPCNAVHTVGMCRPVDLIFLAPDLKALRVVQKVKPLTPAVGCPGAHSVVEFFSGQWDPLSVSEKDQLEFQNKSS